MGKKGVPVTGRHAAGLARPHMWKYKDELQHAMTIPYLRAKAQAIFRDEGWTLAFEEFYELWKHDWHNRGRDPESICMTRKDFSQPWSNDNVELITRLEHLQKQGEMRREQGIKYRTRGPDRQKRKPRQPKEAL